MNDVIRCPLTLPRLSIEEGRSLTGIKAIIGDEQNVSRLRLRLGFSRGEASSLQKLYDADGFVSEDQLWSNGLAKPSIHTYMCRIRKKLYPYGIKIERGHYSYRLAYGEKLKLIRIVTNRLYDALEAKDMGRYVLPARPAYIVELPKRNHVYEPAMAPA